MVNRTYVRELDGNEVEYWRRESDEPDANWRRGVWTEDEDGRRKTRLSLGGNFQPSQVPDEVLLQFLEDTYQHEMREAAEKLERLHDTVERTLEGIDDG